MKKIFKLLIIFLIPLSLYSKADFKSEGILIEESLNKAVQLYKEGDIKQARKITQDAYFSHFENLEGPIRINFSRQKASSMESQFGEIRKAIISGSSVDDIQARVDKLNKEIEEVIPTLVNGYQLVAEKMDNSVNDSGANLVKKDETGAKNPWMEIYNKISTQLDKVNSDYDLKKYSEAKNILNSDIKFNLYRNSKLEIAVRKYISQNFDQQIQQIIDTMITDMQTIQPNRFHQAMKDISDLILTAINKLPADSYTLAPKKAQDEAEKSVDFSQVVARIKEKMHMVMNEYEKGNIEGAVADAQDIYFDEYEDSGLENKVGIADASLKTSTEATFSKIYGLIQNKASKDKIQEAQNELFNKLDLSLEKIGDSQNPWTTFIWSFTIILREGFEALIIVAAVVTYLIKTGNSNKLSIVYSSLGSAVVLSFITAFMVSIVFKKAGQFRELLEGFTMLIAVVLLFYVGFWLLSKAGGKRWNNYIQEQVSNSLTNNSKKALWWTVFLAVFREGAETILFYAALVVEAKTANLTGIIAAGFISGIIVLIIAYFIFRFFAVKIPIRQFFLFTSTIIFYMAIVFVGRGVSELSEGKVIILKPINWLSSFLHNFPPLESFLQNFLGVYPYYQTLVPQIIMVIVLILGIIVMKSKQKIS